MSPEYQKWEIDKSFTWEMGHRVHAQKLDRPDLSITTSCDCKKMHGHSYTAKVFLTATELNREAMVIDFKNLEFLKKFIDSELDHKCMIDVSDPNLSLIVGYLVDDNERAALKSLIADTFYGYINLGYVRNSNHDDVQEHRDSFILVDFIPTSENICKFLAMYAQIRLSDTVVVSSVELWETAKSHCKYSFI